MNMKDLANFALESQKLKDEARKGWKVKAKVGKPESVAEHTYGVAILAMLLGDYKKLDTEKCIKMALLHDLSEVIIGDLLPGENSNKREDEHKAMRKLLKVLSNDSAKHYLEIWNEFRAGRSKEAKLVHELDKLEMVIQAFRYRQGGVKRKNLLIFVESAKKSISDDYIKNMFDDFATRLLN